MLRAAMSMSHRILTSDMNRTPSSFFITQTVTMLPSERMRQVYWSPFGSTCRSLARVRKQHKSSSRRMVTVSAGDVVFGGVVLGVHDVAAGADEFDVVGTERLARQALGEAGELPGRARAVGAFGRGHFPLRRRRGLTRGGRGDDGRGGLRGLQVDARRPAADRLRFGRRGLGGEEAELLVPGPDHVAVFELGLAGEDVVVHTRAVAAAEVADVTAVAATLDDEVVSRQFFVVQAQDVADLPADGHRLVPQLDAAGAFFVVELEIGHRVWVASLTQESRRRSHGTGRAAGRRGSKIRRACSCHFYRRRSPAVARSPRPGRDIRRFLVGRRCAPNRPECRTLFPCPFRPIAGTSGLPPDGRMDPSRDGRAISCGRDASATITLPPGRRRVGGKMPVIRR